MIKNIRTEFAIGIILLIAVPIGLLFYLQIGNLTDGTSGVGNTSVLKDMKPEILKEENKVFCTQDAKQCSDGSYVSRTGPNCEFAECSADKKTNKNQECVEYDIKKNIYQRGGSAVTFKINISEDEIRLLSKPTIQNSGYPNYYLGKYPYLVQLISAKGDVLDEYGFDDPRFVQAELGYAGPTILENVDINLALPFLEEAKKINILYCQKTMLSMDI